MSWDTLREPKCQSETLLRLRRPQDIQCEAYFLELKDTIDELINERGAKPRL